MTPFALVTPPLVLAAVLVVAGVAKVMTKSRREAAAELLSAPGVPSVVNAPWVRRVHPWLEIGLGLALLAPWPGNLAAAVLALLLCGFYTWLMAQLLKADEPQECACFGALSRGPVSRRDLVRNVGLVALSVLAVLWAALGRSVPADLAAFGVSDWWWFAAVLLAAVVPLAWRLASRRGRAPQPATRSAGGSTPAAANKAAGTSADAAAGTPDPGATASGAAATDGQKARGQDADGQDADGEGRDGTASDEQDAGGRTAQPEERGEPAPVQRVRWLLSDQPAPSTLEEAQPEDLTGVALPDVMVRPIDGDTLISLRRVAPRRAVLLILVRPACNACNQVLAQLEGWRAAWGERVDVRLLVSRDPERFLEEHPALRPLVLEDPSRAIQRLLGVRYTPSALLVAPDATIAAGPTTGPEYISGLADVITGSMAPAEDAPAESNR